MAIFNSYVSLPEGKSHETHIDQWPVLNPQGLTALATIYPEVRTFVLMTPFKFLEFQSWTGPYQAMLIFCAKFWGVLAREPSQTYMKLHH